jgi:prepilin-type N-terminal cleavage/methylation domain-containing protein
MKVAGLPAPCARGGGRPKARLASAPPRGSRSCPSREAGFSLLEVIVAVTLVALIAVSLWAAFRVTVRSWNRGTEFIDINQRNRTILDLVKKQVASTYALIAPIDLQTGGAIYPIFNGEESSLQFITLTSLRFHENPGLTMVSYDVIRDRNGVLSLVERETRYLGLDPQQANALSGRDEQSITVFEGLESFSFEYFDPGNQERPSQWMKSWNGRELGRVPTAVSMTMVARDSRGGMLNRHLVIPINARPYDPRLTFTNPFENRPRRLRDDDERNNR